MDQLVHDPTEDLVSYLKLYILMYADDTVSLAESPEDLQKYLITLNEYCNNFDLKINTSKTKLFIFSRGKLRNIPSFKFADMKLDVVNDYNYLGVTFNFNAKFNVAKQSLYQKGCRAMFAQLKRIKSLSLPPDIALKLFDTLVKPVVLYGFSGIWTNQSLPKSPDHFNTILKLRLHDQFIQNWNEGITKGGKCTVYRIIINTFGFEKYLTELPVNNRILMTKFWCRNHRLPIEAGCRAQTQRDLRLCLHCNDIGV